MFKLSSFLFEKLLLKAKKNIRSRESFNIHQNHSESCQRLLNAINIGSYIQPHRHFQANKKEMLIAMVGKFAIIEFFENGDFKNYTIFATEKFLDKNISSVAVELSSDCWHTVIALEPMSVLLEIKEGPFNPNEAKDLAPWAPSPESKDVNEYVKKLYKYCCPELILSNLNID